MHSDQLFVEGKHRMAVMRRVAAGMVATVGLGFLGTLVAPAASAEPEPVTVYETSYQAAEDAGARTASVSAADARSGGGGLLGGLGGDGDLLGLGGGGNGLLGLNILGLL